MPIDYMITLDPVDSIDRRFFAIVERALDNTLQLHQPGGAYVVLIDNWFDHKWLEFNSNKNHCDVSGWRVKLMLPPFEPSRVLSQSYFHACTPAPRLYEAAASNPLHILSSRRSVGEISESGVFVWYSSTSEHSDRASLMVYLSDNGRGSAWYASFKKNHDWHVDKVKGISKREFTELMTAPKTMEAI